MKKYFVLLFVLALLAAMLCACNGNGENTTGPTGDSTTNPTTTAPSTQPSATEPPATGDNGHAHNWQAATCESAMVCADCGQTSGEPLGHSWQAATCTSPKKCAHCGKTEGTTTDHSWQVATCASPKHCVGCGITQGEALPHTWKEADCTHPKTCTVCYATEGTALGHTWTAENCESPRSCTVCGYADGEAKGHTWVAATTEAPKTCSNCGQTEGDRIITDPRFRTEDCKAFFGTWAGVTKDSECKVFFDNKGEMIVIQKKNQYETETTYGVYYVSDGVVYMASGWDKTMTAVSAVITDGVLQLTQGEKTAVMTPFINIHADYLDPRFQAEACKPIVGTWAFEGPFLGYNAAVNCVFTADGYVYVFASVDGGITEDICRVGRYYVEGNMAYGGFCWAEEMRSMEFELVNGQLKGTFMGLTASLEKKSSATEDFTKVDQLQQFDKQACSGLFGTWKGTRNGKSVTYTFGEDGNLVITTQKTDGTVVVTRRVYFVGGKNGYYQKVSWMDERARQDGTYTLNGDQLTLVIGGATVTLTKVS